MTVIHTTPHSARPRLGIVSALAEEQNGILEQMQDRHSIELGSRTYTTGRLWGMDCVCVLARIGKVGAAATSTLLIGHFGVSHILFTGVAGGAQEGVKVGDLVLGEEFIQHDMDCSPLFPRFEIPLSGRSRFQADAGMNRLLARAAQDFLAQDLAQVVPAPEREVFALHAPNLHHGLIASGDQFMDDRQQVADLRADLPDLLALEMEGAAVAQVCAEFAIPFAVIRTISDSSNENSAPDFTRFVEQVAARYAYGIVHRFCQLASREWTHAA